MSSIITYGAAAVAYTASLWSRSNNKSGILDTAKIALQDAMFVAKLPYTLYSCSKEADVKYAECQKGVENIAKSSFFSSIESPIRSTLCEGYKYQSVFFGVAALYALYKLMPYAKSLFNGIIRGKGLIGGKGDKAPKVIEKQDLNQEIQFLNTLIQKQGLVARKFSYSSEEGLVLKMTTTQFLEKLSTQLQKNYDVEMIENKEGHLVALEIKRDGYVIAIDSSDE